MKKEKAQATVTKIERLKNSVYGNPSWRVMCFQVGRRVAIMKSHTTTQQKAIYILTM